MGWEVDRGGVWRLEVAGRLAVAMPEGPGDSWSWQLFEGERRVAWGLEVNAQLARDRGEGNLRLMAGQGRYKGETDGN